MGIHCILYADDLATVSLSPIRLQRALNQLPKYCEIREMQVNKKKTKVMVFTKGHKKTVTNSGSKDKEQLEVVYTF